MRKLNYVFHSHFHSNWSLLVVVVVVVVVALLVLIDLFYLIFLFIRDMFGLFVVPAQRKRKHCVAPVAMKL